VGKSASKIPLDPANKNLGISEMRAACEGTISTDNLAA